MVEKLFPDPFYNSLKFYTVLQSLVSQGKGQPKILKLSWRPLGFKPETF